MNLIALMPVRNEDWCLGLTARAALMWADHLILLLHACTDRSMAIACEVAAEHEGRVEILLAHDAAWDEMNHRQQLLRAARVAKATHVAIVDADEILTGNIVDRVRAGIESPGREWLSYLPGYNVRQGIHRYHSTGIWADRWFAFAFADDGRLNWQGDCFHHREPMGLCLREWRPFQQGEGGVLHLWGASERRLVAKHALYKMTERLRWPAKCVEDIERPYNFAFSPAAHPGFCQRWEYAEVPASWWARYGGLMDCLSVDAEPWQAAECRRLYAEHGAQVFAGLSLFGVC